MVFDTLEHAARYRTFMAQVPLKAAHALTELWLCDSCQPHACSIRVAVAYLAVHLCAAHVPNKAVLFDVCPEQPGLLGIQVLKGQCPQLLTLDDGQCISAMGVVRGSAWHVHDLADTHYRFGRRAHVCMPLILPAPHLR